MCGISGTIGLADRQMIEAMTDAIAHRGPDDCGIFVDAERAIALGHRRLSIIDLSRAAHQPMSYRDNRYWIVFNGEIYNYKNIRSDLESCGHQFRSNSDTEVLLAAYAEWGVSCLDHLRGMFAFAIYDRTPKDSKSPRFFLARDRFGIKPLYFAKINRIVLFASEIKALLASGLISRQVDYQAVWDYLSLGSIPQPRTILADVKALLPGHAMVINNEGHNEIFQYWDIASASAGLHSRLQTMAEAEAAEELRCQLDEATRLHMIADVPIGAFLSGGIDSTAVLGLMNQYVSEPIKTYSVGFESHHAQLNEFAWARLVAERMQTEHTEVVVTGDDIAKDYDQFIQAIDQPSLDGSNTFLVSRAARTGVTVALSGLGGDELFAGYPHFQRFIQAAKWDDYGFFSGKLKELTLKAMPYRWLPDKNFISLDAPARHSTIRSLASEVEKVQITAPSFLSKFEPRRLNDLYEQLLQPGLDPIAQTSYVELKGYLANTLLRDADAMSMSQALEVRPILLDHKLAEFIFALPAEWKVNGAINKWLLVEALRDILPEAIINRPKMGFEMPLFEWLCSSLKKRAIAALSSRCAAAIFSAQFLMESKQILNLPTGKHTRLWAYVMLIEWLNYYQCEF